MEGEACVHGFAFHVVLHVRQLLLVFPNEELPLACVLGDCVGQRLGWTLRVHLVPLGLELRAIVVVIEVLRHLAPLGVCAPSLPLVGVDVAFLVLPQR